MGEHLLPPDSDDDDDEVNEGEAADGGEKGNGAPLGQFPFVFACICVLTSEYMKKAAYVRSGAVHDGF